MVFYCNGILFETGRKFYAFIVRTCILQYFWSGFSASFAGAKELWTKNTASIPPFSAAGRTLDHPVLRSRRRLPAVYTVEAAIVSSVVLLAIGTLIKEAYVLHDKVTGAMILEETLEQAAGNVEKDREDDYFAKRGENLGSPRLWLGKYSVKISRKQSRIIGNAWAGNWELQIERKNFSPHEFLRRVQALAEIEKGLGNGGN